MVFLTTLGEEVELGEEEAEDELESAVSPCCMSGPTKDIDSPKSLTFFSAMLHVQMGVSRFLK